MPAHHIARDQLAFEETVNQAKVLAEQDGVVTFGISPTHPNTGYGYIEAGNDFNVERLIEKPDFEMALSYIGSGDYLCNSGIFLVKAGIT